MREIKFRAWGCQRRPQDKFKMFYQKDFDVEKFLKNVRNKCLGWELLQFTGLLDKNGKEIYEGDIVEIETTHDLPQKGEKSKYKVDFFDGSYIPFTFDSSERYEVIGNIYENPELLKED